MPNDEMIQNLIARYKSIDFSAVYPSNNDAVWLSMRDFQVMRLLCDMMVRQMERVLEDE